MTRLKQEIRFCTSRDGTRIAYAVCGEGPPLVRAGHAFTHLENERDCLAYGHWVELFSRRHTLIRYDTRGCGLSDRDDVEYSMQHLSEDLEAVVEAAGVKRFDLVGMTGGGALAVTYAVRHPEAVNRMVLYGTFAKGRYARSNTSESNWAGGRTTRSFGSYSPTSFSLTATRSSYAPSMTYCATPPRHATPHVICAPRLRPTCANWRPKYVAPHW